MKKIFFSFFALSLTFAVKASALPVDALLGHWVTEYPVYDGNMQFQLSFDFELNSTTMTVECLYPYGGNMFATATAGTHYQANEIFIHETREAVASDGYRFCRATLRPSRWTAYFDGTGRMILFIPVPYQARFTLIQPIY